MLDYLLSRSVSIYFAIGTVDSMMPILDITDSRPYSIVSQIDFLFEP